MGENIGTTATANLAALGANTQARRAALAHLVFNVFGVIWVLCVFYPFVDLVCSLVGYNPAEGGQTTLLPVVLATFHTCFNVTNTAILIGLIPQMERLVCWLLPDRQEARQEEEFRLQYIQANLMQTPEISVLQAQKETAHFGQRVQQMFGMVRKLLEEQDDDKFQQLYNKVAHQEDITDKMEIEIARYLEQVSNNHLSDITKQKVRQMLREISELESIGDACYNLARTLNRRHESGKDFTPALYDKLRRMMQLTDEALTQMNNVMTGHSREHDIRDTYRIENDINQLRQQLKAENVKAVNDHDYDYAIGTMYTDMVGECEKLGDYVVNVVQARFGK
jgi:phosphate:Na+ symporter